VWVSGSWVTACDPLFTLQPRTAPRCRALPFPGRSGPSPNAWFLGATRVHNPNGISIGSAVFAQLMVMTNRHTQTDRQTTLHTLCPPKRPPFYFLNNSAKNLPILIIFGTLNPEKNWHENLTDLSTSPAIYSHFTLVNPKSHFSTSLSIYFRLSTLAQTKINSNNCCTAASAVYLLLSSASYYLHSPSTASGARYKRSTCIDTDMLRLAAAACCDMGWISAQRGIHVLCDWSVLKKVETCIKAEGGHSEHLLWHCLPDIPVATHHKFTTSSF